jgi:hypothetical protein
LYDDRLSNILKDYTHDRVSKMNALHQYAKELLDMNDVDKAWQVLMAGE